MGRIKKAKRGEGYLMDQLGKPLPVTSPKLAKVLREARHTVRQPATKIAELLKVPRTSYQRLENGQGLEHVSAYMRALLLMGYEFRLVRASRPLFQRRRAAGNDEELEDLSPAPDDNPQDRGEGDEDDPE